MDEFEIEVIGREPSRKPEGRFKQTVRQVGRLLRALLMRPRVLAFSGLTAFALFVGTPHAGWDYECRYPMRSGEPCRSVSYCAYYGIQGRRVVFPDQGQSCQLVSLLPLDWERLIGE